MGETSYGRSRNLSVNWEFSKISFMRARIGWIAMFVPVPDTQALDQYH
jgi:hypothetical protein